MNPKLSVIPVFVLMFSLPTIGFASGQTSDTMQTLQVGTGNGNSFGIPYSISGATVTSAKADTSIPQLTISISATSDGQITLQVPGGNSNQNDFTVLVDGQPSQFTQSVDNGHRMVTISFHASSSTIELVGNHATQASQYSQTIKSTISCTQDNMTAAKQGLAELEKKMADLRTQYYNEWQTAYNSGQYNGTWEQYSREKVMSSPDVTQLKSEYQKYSSMLCGPSPVHLSYYSGTTCSQSDIANARQELETTMKQGMDLRDKMYQQFQQAQTSGQFNGTWSQYAQENFYNLPDVMQLKSTHDKYTSFLKSCFGNQMPAPQSGMLQNPDYNSMHALPQADNPNLSSVPSDNLGPAPTGNDLGLGDNSPNTTPQNDQHNQLPPLSSPTDVQGLLASSHGIPPWVRGIAGWWAEGKISDNDFVTAIKFLVQHGIIKV